MRLNRGAELAATRSELGIQPAERLIVALDVPTIADARQIVGDLQGVVSFFKIGMQLQFAGGLDLSKELVASGKKVFLDSKLLDIEQTVESAVRSIALLGATFLTVHGNGRMIDAAIRGRGSTKLRILSVTVLTNLDAFDLQDLGYSCSPEELVLIRAQKALEAGADGVITSGQEAEKIRALAGGKLTIVTPGIRPNGAEIGDQRRVMTPGKAIRAGADYIVVGRPILQADNRRDAAIRIVEEIADAMQESYLESRIAV